ncbi:FkbM family methyltransferase [Streptomyces sp. NPDC101165]|uniref:FkbM family methyltransferase n=1 Tax=Streptomyces sp. NPDC101165 TaxID=3366119 RepID=UPI00381F99E2
MTLLGKALWALRHPAPHTSAATMITRLAVWRARTALHMGATVSLPGPRMAFWCPPEWRGNAKIAYVWRDDYEIEVSQLHRWVRPGDVVMDVGAHYGSYTLPLAGLVGPQGLVLAMDPFGHARSVLQRNLEINDLHNVQILPVAAGAQAGHATLHMHDDRSRASLHASCGNRPETEQAVMVRLDDVVPPGRRIALIKMDIEGYEAQALQGAEQILERDRPVVIFELVWRKPGAAAPDRTAWDLLAACGYRMHRFTDQGELRRVEGPEQHCGSTCNVVAVHPDSRSDIGVVPAQTEARAELQGHTPTQRG